MAGKARRLPSDPRSSTDQYLAAIYDELRGLRAELAKDKQPVSIPQDGTIELREPVKPSNPDEPNPRLIADMEPKPKRWTRKKAGD